MKEKKKSVAIRLWRGTKRGVGSKTQYATFFQRKKKKGAPRVGARSSTKRKKKRERAYDTIARTRATAKDGGARRGTGDVGGGRGGRGHVAHGGEDVSKVARGGAKGKGALVGKTRNNDGSTEEKH